MFLSAAGSVLLLIDLQQRLVPAIADGRSVVATAERLAQAAHLLDVPVRATEQNPAGLGHTVPELAGYPLSALAKTAFDAGADPGFADLLPTGVREVVLVGVEAHVCVLQTALGLIARRRRVLVVADAVGSRKATDRAVALDRLQRHGVEVMTSEMVIFEWLRDSTHPRVREVQQLLR